MSQLNLVHTAPLIYLHLVSVLYCDLGLGVVVMCVLNKVLRRVYCVVRHCCCSFSLSEHCFQLVEYPLKICRNSLPDFVSSNYYPLLTHCPSETLRYPTTEQLRCGFEKFCKDSSEYSESAFFGGVVVIETLLFCFITV